MLWACEHLHREDDCPSHCYNFALVCSLLTGSPHVRSRSRIRAVTLKSTIISDNHIGASESDASFDSPAGSTGANNLFGVTTDLPAGIGHLSVNDPKLGPLVVSGGFARVHMPLPNSLAINHGNNSDNATYDERGPGFPRVIGSAPDIGAAEYDPARIFNNGFD